MIERYNVDYIEHLRKYFKDESTNRIIKAALNDSPLNDTELFSLDTLSAKLDVCSIEWLLAICDLLSISVSDTFALAIDIFADIIVRKNHYFVESERAAAQEFLNYTFECRDLPAPNLAEIAAKF